LINKVTQLLKPALNLSGREKPELSMAARVVGDAMDSSGFSPGISQRELWEIGSRFAELELLCL
jgi:hypothetical protein